MTARSRAGPSVENHHRDGILRVTRAPAPGLDDALQARAEARIRPLLDDLDYVGVCCVELFDVGDDLARERDRTRVHNSGHWTIEGAETSQFENHLRARFSGWPLGSTAARGPSAMVNCIGTLPDRDAVLRIPRRAPARLRQGRRARAARSATSRSPRPSADDARSARLARR